MRRLIKDYVYRTAHSEVLCRRRDWFEKFDGMYLALWWVKSGHMPTVAGAKHRLAYFEENGETEQAFTFRNVFAPSAPAQLFTEVSMELCGSK